MTIIQSKCTRKCLLLQGYCSLKTILSGGEISPRANPCEVARTASHAIARPHQLDCEYKHMCQSGNFSCFSCFPGASIYIYATLCIDFHIFSRCLLTQETPSLSPRVSGTVVSTEKTENTFLIFLVYPPFIDYQTLRL